MYMIEKCPVCLNMIYSLPRIFNIHRENKSNDENKWLVFPYCKHAICFSCGVNIMKHTPGNTNIKCPLCRRHMLHGVMLGP